MTRARHLTSATAAVGAVAASVVLASCGSFGESNSAPDGGGGTAVPESSTETAPPGIDGAVDASAPGTHDMVAITTVDGNYLIDAKEVTTAEFALFLDAVKTGAFEPTDARCDWKAGTDYGGGAPKCPTTPAAAYGCADWCDAIEYCTWAKKRLCGKIGGGPVDENDTRDLHRSQWTRACAGQTSAMSWPYGAAAQSVCNTKERGVAAALAPASSAACVGSAAGLFDMSGNVGEWEDACTAIGPTENCSIRGGSFKQTIDGARCSGELLGVAAGTFGDVGIRCCKDM